MLVRLLLTESRSALLTTSRPKSLLNDSCVMVVPMKALSYPYAITPIDMMSAEAYTFQLYTSCGVGRSSGARAKPVMLATGLIDYV
jgi:hypothetical protein